MFTLFEIPITRLTGEKRRRKIFELKKKSIRRERHWFWPTCLSVDALGRILQMRRFVKKSHQVKSICRKVETPKLFM